MSKLDDVKIGRRHEAVVGEKFLTSLFYNVADGRLVADVYLTPDEKDADYKIVITRGSGIYEDLIGKYKYCNGYDDVTYIFSGIINERKVAR